MSGGRDGTVFAIAVSGTDVYAGGMFSNYFSVFHNELGFWQNIGTNGTVYALAVTGADVYVGGNFTSPVTHVAKWNGSSWSALGSGVNELVLALAVSGTDVYAGGYFTDAGGFAVADYVARWNGSSWLPMGSGVNGTVHTLTASGTDIYAGGEFTMAGGSLANYIAKWNGTSWSALGSGLNYYPNVITAKGMDVYAGGLFGQAGGVWVNCIAKWNGAGWSALASGLDNQAFAIAASGRHVYVGGFFLHAGGKLTYYLARWVEPLSVDSPNGGESWDTGSAHAVTWTADAAVGPVKIEYSTNNGSTWTTVVASTPNTGSYSWTIPNTPSAACRVRISEAADGDPVDASDGAFSIAGFRVTAPGSGDTWSVGTPRTITWSTVGSFATVRLELSTDNGATWQTITANTANTGSYVWTVAGAFTSQAVIRVSDSTDGLPFDDSALFSIIPVQALTLTSPNGGEIWEAGTRNTITWTADASILNIRLQYSTDNGATWSLIMLSTSNDGSYDWYPPNTLSTSCRVRVFDADDGEPVDMSDGAFSIAGFQVISPDGHTWEPGSSQMIIWATLGSYLTVRIEFSPDGGATWETITASTANTGSCPWTVPDLESWNCLIRVSDSTDGVPSDTGSLVITEPPMIQVLSPNGGESWLAGTIHDITWTSSGITGLMRIAYSTNNGASFSMVAITPNDGSYSWTLPGVLSSECLVQMSDFYMTVEDTSDAVFSVVGSQTITVTAPNGGESWATGSTHDITWTQAGLTESVTIDLYKGGILSKTLGTAAATAGTFSWALTAGETAGPDYRVRVWQGSVSDQSGADFAIVRFPKRVDFNRDDLEDILWRYYGSGGYNRAWFLGDTGESALPLSVDDTAIEAGSRGSKPDGSNIWISAIRNGAAPLKDPPDVWGYENRQDSGPAMVDDPRRAGGKDPTPPFMSVADPRYAKLTVIPERSGDHPVELASMPFYLGGADIMPVADLSWQIVGTGDFDDDSHVDILWRNTSSGSNVVWLMNGTDWSSSVELIPVADQSWQIVGTGDFNYDGHVDILWRNGSSGSNVVWYMNGTAWIGSAVLLGVSDPTWRIAGTGDFNEDGYVDILWRYNGTGGYNVVWHMDPAGWIGSAELISVGDTSWMIMGTGDYNNDGNLDILWRYNGAGGYNYIWYMDGVTWTGGGDLLPVADLTWRIVSR